jgi:hypothetical protein
MLNKKINVEERMGIKEKDEETEITVEYSYWFLVRF